MLSRMLHQVIFYAIITLLAYHFPPIIPLIIAMIIQCFCIGIWIIVATYIHRFLFPPLDVLLVYEGTTKDSFVSKVKTRRHQFKINDTVLATEDFDCVTKKIDEHKAVMMWDVSAERRNVIFKYCYEHSVEIYVMPKIMDSRVDSVVNDTVTEVAMRHFGFLSDDVDADIARLTAAGARLVVHEKAPGFDGAMLKDPSGISIQFVKRAKPVLK